MATASEFTQMITFPIPADRNVHDNSTDEGRTWSEMLKLAEQHSGFKRLYWGRLVEDQRKVQLHIVRKTLLQHYGFITSANFHTFKKLAVQLTGGGELTIRHAVLTENSPNCQALGKGAPVTGTAIYLGTDEAWDAAWALWATIVPHVQGCLGISGGYIIEPIEGHERCFIAWVGWENVEVHSAYHHTEHFRERSIILRQGHKGFREYGHAAFNHTATNVKPNI